MFRTCRGHARSWKALLNFFKLNLGLQCTRVALQAPVSIRFVPALQILPRSARGDVSNVAQGYLICCGLSEPKILVRRRTASCEPRFVEDRVMKPCLRVSILGQVGVMVDFIFRVDVVVAK